MCVVWLKRVTSLFGKVVNIRFVAFSMDLNKASLEQLMEVQLIGEVLSKRILKHRPFSSWAEVKELAQIGDRRLQKLKAEFVINCEKASTVDAQTQTDGEFEFVETPKLKGEPILSDAP